MVSGYLIKGFYNNIFVSGNGDEYKFVLKGENHGVEIMGERDESPFSIEKLHVIYNLKSIIDSHGIPFYYYSLMSMKFYNDSKFYSENININCSLCLYFLRCCDLKECSYLPLRFKKFYKSLKRCRANDYICVVGVHFSTDMGIAINVNLNTNSLNGLVYLDVPFSCNLYGFLAPLEYGSYILSCYRNQDRIRLLEAVGDLPYYISIALQCKDYKTANHRWLDGSHIMG